MLALVLSLFAADAAKPASKDWPRWLGPDGDGDRHMIVSRNGPVTPSDSIAVLAAVVALLLKRRNRTPL